MKAQISAATLANTTLIVARALTTTTDSGRTYLPTRSLNACPVTKSGMAVATVVLMAVGAPNVWSLTFMIHEITISPAGHVGAGWVVVHGVVVRTSA